MNHNKHEKLIINWLNKNYGSLPFLISHLNDEIYFHKDKQLLMKYLITSNELFVEFSSFSMLTDILDVSVLDSALFISQWFQLEYKLQVKYIGILEHENNNI